MGYRTLELTWFRQMAQGFANIHDRRVLAIDISSRNFLLASDLSLKFCDFTEAYVLPLNTDMEMAGYEGFSVQTGIGQTGAVIYEIITGQHVRFDVYQDFDPVNTRANFPRRDTLPSTEGLWLGDVIERCWAEGGFRNAHCLLASLNDVELQYLKPDKAETSDLSICPK